MLRSKALVSLVCLLLSCAGRSVTGFLVSSPSTARSLRSRQCKSPCKSPLRSPSRHSSFSSPASSSPSTELKNGLALDPAAVSASGRALAELLALIGIGVLKKSDLDIPTRKGLSRLLKNVFLPSFLLTNVANTLATNLASGDGGMTKFVVLPLFCVTQIIIGGIVGEVLCRLLGLDRWSEDGRRVRALSAFTNSGPVPLLFVNAMYRSQPETLRILSSYISFFLLAQSPLLWSYGYHVLTCERTEEMEGKKLSMDAEGLSESVSVSAKSANGKDGWRGLVERIFSPAMIASLAGICFGAFGPLRELFVVRSGLLNFVWGALVTLSEGFRPTAALILAGALASGRPFGGDDPLIGKNNAKRAVPLAVYRFMIAPLINLCLVLSLRRMGLLGEDPLLAFILLLQGVMPSAQQSVVMLQLEGKSDEAGRMAKTLTLLYSLGVLPMAFVISKAKQFTGV
uniref:Uncharacterized protein n=1 Tax=Chromera velia CCMP2878 TaxID=1169474 RepID=A0A0G4FFE0_9ALVE|eukprot:Cvel_16694.t1-p1 / transcript=Cvel_16694.t1 / gene=Cvel_16694 / organism=Chromera_velia_CCMP2878 / gene_product=hypothetical protein / transcript_product=hypothetical protein / location=Cvel_scaffold1296:28766-30130(+) / protein_length=455 / sequence_SO=supercontig / SO=protein_coding / is_pseudo=false